MQPMLNRDEMLDEALAYRDRGLSVIPVLQGDGKKAATDWKAYQSQAADMKQVIDWFANDKRNVAIVTGAVSGVLVLDVDNLDGLKDYPALPETPTVKTGKGMHVYFKHPGFEVGNIQIKELGDIRADKGYVVAPPSLHQSGKRYTWEQGLDDVPLAAVPDWLLKLITSKAKLADNDNDEVKTTNYGKAWFDDVEALARETAGGRNNSLNIVACKAGNLIASSQLNENEAKDALFLACKRNGLVQDDGAESVLATIRSGIRAGMNNPRYPQDVLSTVAEFNPKTGRLKVKSLADVEMQKVDWVWPGVLARRSVAMLAGPPGLGKSQATLDIAARISVGGKWPVTNDPAPLGSVIILSLEDVAEYTIKPRLVACGANLANVHQVTTVQTETGERQFNLQQDLKLLEDTIEAIGNVQLIVIDPISGYLGKADTNNSGDVRGITTQLSALAQKHNLCILAVSHLNKSEGKGATNRVQGSVSWIGAARTGFMIERDGEDPEARTMTPIKNNLANDQTAYRFSVQSKDVGNGISTSHVVWQDASMRKTADQVLAEKGDGGMAGKQAKEFLQVMLKAGPMSFTDLCAAYTEAGISKGTFYNAKDALGVIIEQDANDRRKTLWRLPEAA